MSLINSIVPYIDVKNINTLKKISDFCVPDNLCLHVLQLVTCVAFFSSMIIF
jgi:hypothetical protein